MEYKYKDYGEKLKKAIKKKGVTQKVFAEMTGFTEQYISNLCKGTKYIGSNAYKFAKILGVRPEYLLCLDDCMTPKGIMEFTTDELLAEIKRRIEAS